MSQLKKHLSHQCSAQSLSSHMAHHPASFQKTILFAAKSVPHGKDITPEQLTLQLLTSQPLTKVEVTLTSIQSDTINVYYVIGNTLMKDNGLNTVSRDPSLTPIKTIVKGYCKGLNS